MDINQHLNNSLAKIRPLFEKAIARIEAIKPGDKIPATKLADDIAKEAGLTGPAFYPVLRFLLDGYPGVEIRRGAHGGITRLDPNAKLKGKPASPAPSDEMETITSDE